jgi:plastocyanin
MAAIHNLLVALLLVFGVASAVDVPISLYRSNFTPSAVTVNIGDRVVWTWQTSDNHTITQSDSIGSCNPNASPKFASAYFAANGTTYTYTVTYADVGIIIPFFCIPHCQFGMRGTITVLPEPCLLNNYNCVGRGGVCQATPPTNVSQNWQLCTGSLQSNTCSNNFCIARPTDRQPCSTSGGAPSCYDNYQDVSCLSSNFCGGQNAMGPGEQCNNDPTQALFYVNGGCVSGLQCSGAIGSGTCSPSIASGASCSNSGSGSGSSTQCGPGLYCGSGNTCQTRLNVGATCRADTDCRIDLYCRRRDGTCQSYFSGTVGATCDSFISCQAGLFCNRQGQCATPPIGGQTCGSTGSTCPDGSSCSCNSLTNNPNGPFPSQTCVTQCTLNPDETSRISSLLSCAAAANCQGTLNRASAGSAGLLSFYRGSCLERNCAGQYRGAVDALNRCNSISGFCSAASAMGVSSALLVLLGIVVALLLA